MNAIDHTAAVLDRLFDAMHKPPAREPPHSMVKCYPCGHVVDQLDFEHATRMVRRQLPDCPAEFQQICPTCGRDVDGDEKVYQCRECGGINEACTCGDPSFQSRDNGEAI